MNAMSQNGLRMLRLLFSNSFFCATFWLGLKCGLKGRNLLSRCYVIHLTQHDISLGTENKLKPR